MQKVLGITLVITSSIFAAFMMMRGIGRFMIFLVVDRPEIGAGFLLSTFATTGLALYLAWVVGSKGLDYLAQVRTGIQEKSDAKKLLVKDK